MFPISLRVLLPHVQLIALEHLYFWSFLYQNSWLVAGKSIVVILFKEAATD